MLTKKHIQHKHAYGSGCKKLVFVIMPFVSCPHVFRVTRRLMMAIIIRKYYKVDIKYFTRVWRSHSEEYFNLKLHDLNTSIFFILILNFYLIITLFLNKNRRPLFFPTLSRYFNILYRIFWQLSLKYNYIKLREHFITTLFNFCNCHRLYIDMWHILNRDQFKWGTYLASITSALMRHLFDGNCGVISWWL